MKNKLLLAALLFFGISSICQSQRIPVGVYPPADLIIPDLSPGTQTYYPKRIAEFKKNPLEPNDIVFIGCSVTELGGDWGIRFNSPIIKNRGISGDVTSGVLARLGEIDYFKPSAVFILIGLNDLFAGETADFVVNNIIKIVQNIRQNTPGTKIYVQTILPTLHYYMVDKIKAVNDGLRKNAAANNYTLIDLHIFFADGSDLIKKEYVTLDSVHLTPEGYKTWVNAEKRYIPTITNLLKNADLQAYFANWTVSGTSGMFKMGTWSPLDPFVKSFGNNYWDWNNPIDGCITQTVTNLQDGKYIFCGQFAGASPGLNSYSALIAKIDNNTIAEKAFIMPANFTKFKMPFEVTGGKCSVGFRIKDTEYSEFWWDASTFWFYLTEPANYNVINNKLSANLTSTPNPFSKNTILSFSLPDSENNVKLEIFNKDGLLVKSFTESKVVANKLYNYKFSSDKYEEQIFIVRLVTPNKVQTLKLIKTK